MAVHSAVSVGEVTTPVPKKACLKWEYVEIPEFWFSARDDEQKKPTQTRRPRKVTDITTWTQCFATFVSVLGPQNPAAIPELMAYMSNVIRASQDYEGLAWEWYDAAFRKQAAATGNRMWSKINGSLYSICFSNC